MSANLRVTMIQAELAWQAPITNRRQLAAHFRGLAGHTDLILLPEMFTTGFTMDAEGLAEDMDGDTVHWLREESAAWGCAIAGSIIVRDGHRYFNRFLFAKPDGTIDHYDKRHLFRMAKEHEHFKPGTHRKLIEFKGWRLCPQICYDLRFPVWSRNRGNDYDALLYVANWPARRRLAWTSLLRARAIENLCYVVGVNRIGKDGNGTSYAGDSAVYDFKGQTLGGEHGRDFVETVVLYREALEDYRTEFPAHLDADDFEIPGVVAAQGR